MAHWVGLQVTGQRVRVQNPALLTCIDQGPLTDKLGYVGKKSLCCNVYVTKIESFSSHVIPLK